MSKATIAMFALLAATTIVVCIAIIALEALR